MKQIKAVVVDDEPLARSRITKLLQQDAAVQLAGECRNGTEAINFIHRKKPDLIFLDIQMPDLNGFSVLSELDEAYKPFIIFVTAYDQYALKAFDVHAIDYLLKPFNDARFFESLERAKAQIQLKQTSDLSDRMFHLMKEYQHQQGAYLQNLSLKENGRVQVVDLEEVNWIESGGNYITLHLATRYHVYRTTMNALESELDPQHFIRIHRSYIVNFKYIEDVKYLNNNEYKFILTNGQELISGRSFKTRIEDYLKQVEV